MASSLLMLLLLVTELTDELKYDIVVPLTTSVELYQFFQSDVVIFVEKSNDDNVLLLSLHCSCSGRFTNNISSKYAQQTNTISQLNSQLHSSLQVTVSGSCGLLTTCLNCNLNNFYLILVIFWYCSWSADYATWFYNVLSCKRLQTIQRNGELFRRLSLLQSQNIQQVK